MPSAPRTAREVARVELTRAILDSARRQLAEVGPAALSVRAVARDLEMASSAVYRYFPSRDALLTALLIEAYDDVGAAVEAADGSVRRRADVAVRWRKVCRALRDWAVQHPHDYALLYGSPVPGYAAPQDTVASATRIPAVLLGILADAQADGRSVTTTAMPVPRREQRALAGVRGFVTGVGDEALVRALMAWETLFGHLSLELFGHMHNGVLDFEAHFDHVVERLAEDLGLRD